MSNSLRELFCLSIFLVVLFSACEDSTIVGSKIFDGEELEVLFTDDIELITRTIKVDTFENYRINNTSDPNCPNGSLPTLTTGITSVHHLGALKDPIFGNSTSSIYTEVFPSSAAPTYQNGKFDSLVLVLAYDTSSVYGNVDEPFDIEVYRVLEDLLVAEPAYNDTEFLISDEPIAKRTDIIYSRDTLKVFLPEGDSIQQPAIRIAFPDFVLGDMNHLPTQIFNNPAASENTADFTQLLKGLYITMSSESNLMMGIDLTSSLVSRMELFFTDQDSTKSVYNYFLTSKRFNNAVNDPSGTDAEAASNSGDDALMYVSGQDGFDGTIDFSDVSRFADNAINSAVLEFTVAEPEGIDAIHFPPSSQLLITEIDENNEIVSCIDDMILGANTGRVTLGAIFGGELEEVTENGTTLKKYQLNITKHVQNFLEGTVTSRMLLSVTNRSEYVSRSVLYGPNHPTYPAKLKLTYTAP